MRKSRGRERSRPLFCLFNGMTCRTVVAARKRFLGSLSKVESVDVPVPASTLRALGTGSRAVKARWVPKNGEAFGVKLSAEATVQIRG